MANVLHKDLAGSDLHNAKPAAKILVVATSGGDYTTIQAAIAAASGNTIVQVAPGTYDGDIDLGPDVVSLIGSGINATVLTGNITVGDKAHTLRDLNITSAGSLTITNKLTASHLNLACPVTISGSGNFEGATIFLSRTSGVALTMSSTGTCSINGGMMFTGAANAVYHTAGNLVLRNCVVANNSYVNPAINSTGGICVLMQANIANQGGGVAVSMSNDAIATSANQVTDVTASGNVSCGTATTYIEGLNFVVFGSLSGSALVYRPASRIDNDSSAPGATVKDALAGLDARVTALGG